MKTPGLRTFLTLCLIGCASVLVVRTWAQSPSTSAASTKDVYKFVLIFGMVEDNPVQSAKDKTAKEFKKDLKNIKDLASYDIDFYEHAGDLPYHITPDDMTRAENRGVSPSNRQLSPHITQRVSSSSRDAISAVLNMVTDTNKTK